MNQLDETVIIFAFRYALGRTSTAPSVMVDYLIQHWGSLSGFARKQIHKELLSEFGSDDEARSETKYNAGAHFQGPLGWNCDRATWARLLAHCQSHE